MKVALNNLSRQRQKKFFERFGIDTSFIRKIPSEWDADDDYKKISKWYPESEL